MILGRVQARVRASLVMNPHAYPGLGRRKWVITAPAMSQSSDNKDTGERVGQRVRVLLGVHLANRDGSLRDWVPGCNIQPYHASSRSRCPSHRHLHVAADGGRMSDR